MNKRLTKTQGAAPASTEFPFKIHGFYEEVLDADTYKFLGIRFVDKADRQLGSDGRIETTITQPITVLKGYKRIPTIVKASPAAPRKLFLMLQAICGRSRHESTRPDS